MRPLLAQKEQKAHDNNVYTSRFVLLPLCAIYVELVYDELQTQQNCDTAFVMVKYMRLQTRTW